MPPGTDVVSIESRLLSIAPDAMLVVDQTGRIKQVNLLAEQIFGYPPGALAGQPLAMLIPARLRDAHQRHVTTYLRNPRSRPMDAGPILWGLRRDGSEFAAEISLNPLETPQGLHILVAIRDVSEHLNLQQALEQATVELERQVESRNAELVRTNAELRRQIAERAQIEAALRETEALYRQLVENQPDLIRRFLPDTTLTFVNTAYARFFGRQPEDLVGQRFSEFLCAEEQAQVWQQLAAFTLAAPARQHEHKTNRADGIPRWHLWHDFAFFDDQGKVTGFQSVGVDITKRKRAEERLQTINRALRLRSACNQALVKATDEAVLLEEVCRLIVAIGDYRLAWVGLAEQDEAKTVRPVGQAGYHAGYLESIRITWADEEHGQGPTGTAIRTRRPVVARILVTDPHYAPWRAEALERGYASSIALPLCREKQVLGALNIYAGTADAFDAEEIQLLADLADDVAYGLSALRDHAEQKRMAVALQESEERFRQLAEATFEGIAISHQGRLVDVSSQLAEMLGHAPAELIGRDIVDFVAPEARERVRERLRSGNLEPTEHRLQRKDGSTFFVEARVRSMRYQGEMVRISAIRDITERKRAEEALRAQERRFRALIENSADAIALFDPEGTVLYATASTKAILGYEPAEVIGHPVFEFIHPEWQDSLRDRVAESLRNPKDRISACAQALHKDGSQRYLEGAFTNLLDDPAVGAIVVNYRDSTERKRMEEALRISETKYRKLFEEAMDGIGLADLETGLILDCNEALARMVRREKLELIGQPQKILHPPQDHAGPVSRTFELHRTRDKDAVLKTEIVTKTGEIRAVEIKANIVRLEGKEVLQGIFRDITERKRAEDALRASEALLAKTTADAPAMIYQFLLRPDGTSCFPYASAWCWEMFGVPPETLRENAAPLLDRILPDDRPGFEESVACSARTLEPWRHEYRLRSARGDIVWCQGISRPERQADGSTLWNGIFFDTTDRKRAEEALFEEKERAQVTLHSIGDAVITTDAHAVVDYLNPVAEALTGWTMAEAHGRSLSEVFHIVNEQTRQPASDPVIRCLQEGKIVGLANHTVLIRRDGQEYHIDDSAAPIRGRDGRVLGAVLVFHDVTETRQLTRQLEYDATHDALTGLINRPEFERRLARALASARQYGARHALCYLDLDQFKIVNDTAGHAAGDELLRQINTILSGMFRERDTLARIGGDEFGLLLDNCPLNRAQLIAQTVVGSICEHRFHWEGRTYQIGVSIGLTPITAEAQDTTQLLTQADVACYIAKEMGRNRVHLYQREDTETVQRHGEILGAAGLRDALEQGRFRLHYQPIIPLDAPDPRPSRYEVLLRVVCKSSEDANSEVVLPAAFIPAAERYGLMGAIDRWVIQAAFREYANTVGQTGAQIAINLSGNSLSDETLLDFIEARFAEHSPPPGRVCFEITETAAIQNLRRAVELMMALKRHGTQFALDDFGSGLSSFRYLKTLPVDYLKIDGSFVRDMVGNPNDCALVAAINQMSHTLGIQTIAEYVESLAIAERLRELGVDYAQGFFFGHAAPWGQQP